MKTNNPITLTVTITLSDKAHVSNHDKKIIIENVMTALRGQVDTAGLVPDDASYITELLDVRDSNGTGLTYSLLERNFI